MAMAFLGWLIIIFSLLFGLGSVSFIIIWMRHHCLEIRDPLDKKQYITTYWVMEKLDKSTNTMYWQRVLSSFKVSEPPKEAVNVGKRGRKYASCYKLGEDEFVWITDKGIRMEEVNGKVTAMDVQKDGTTKTIDSFKPFTSVQRQVLINQIIKANDISKKRWTPMEVMGVVSMAGIIFTIALLLAFGGDLLKEYRASREGATQVLKMAGDITMKQAYLMDAMGIKIANMDVIVSQTPEVQSGTPTVPKETAQTFDIRSTVGLE